MRIYLTEVKKLKNHELPDISRQVFSNEVGFDHSLLYFPYYFMCRCWPVLAIFCKHDGDKYDVFCEFRISIKIRF